MSQNVKKPAQTTPTEQTARRKPENINQKLTQLQTQIDWFYSDDFDLAQATENYKSAIALTRDIEADLNTMKNDIQVITEDFS